MSAGSTLTIPPIGHYSGTIAISKTSTIALGSTVTLQSVLGAGAGGPAPQRRGRDASGTPSILFSVSLDFLSFEKLSPFPTIEIIGSFADGTAYTIELYDPATDALIGTAFGTAKGGNVIFSESNVSTIPIAANHEYLMDVVAGSNLLPPVATSTPSPSSTPSPGATPTPVPTATPASTPTPSRLTLTTQFGLDPDGGVASLPNPGAGQNQTYVDQDFAYPSSNASGVVVTATVTAVQASAPLTGGTVFRAAFLFSPPAGSSQTAITFNGGFNQWQIFSQMFDPARTYSMVVTNAGRSTTIGTAQAQKAVGGGYYVTFNTPFDGLTVSANSTVTVSLNQTS